MELEKKQPKPQNENPKQKISENKPEDLLKNSQKNTNQCYRIGNYIIEGTVGCGTFGKVKLGIHLPDKERVAIKILDKNKMTEKDDHIRLEREFKILEKFNHPNLIMVTEIFESENHYYTVMELCEGGELFNYIVKKKYLSEDESSFFYYQLISGLEYIHSLGIVHRDLKPENLLLTKDHILKIIDFGLSNFFKEGQDELLYTPCGSPCYSSPEMVSGNNYDGVLIDVWSTGIILFAMLCGYLPFEDKNNEILFKKIVNCKVVYPDYLSSISIDLLKKILVPDPNKRITIPQIKKHPFYLKGKKIFEQEFSIEIIKPKDKKNENNEELCNKEKEDNKNNNNCNFNTEEKSKKKKSMINNINNTNNKIKKDINERNIINSDELARLGQINIASITTSSDGAYISTIEDINNLKINNDENNVANKGRITKRNNKNEEEKNCKKDNFEIIEIVNNSCNNNSLSNCNLEYNNLSNKPVKKNKKKKAINMKNNFEKSENKKNKQEEKQNHFIAILSEDHLKSLNQEEINARKTYEVPSDLNQICEIKKIKNNNPKIKERKTEIAKIPPRKNSPLQHQVNITDLHSLNAANILKINNSIEKTKKDINKNFHKLNTRILNKNKKRVNTNSVKKSPGREINSMIYNTSNNNKIRKNYNIKKTSINKNSTNINKLNDNILDKKLDVKINDKNIKPAPELVFDIANTNNISGSESIVNESGVNRQFSNNVKNNLLTEKSNQKENISENRKPIINCNLRKHIININDRKTIGVNNDNAIRSKILNSKEKNKNENQQKRQSKLIKKITNNNEFNMNSNKNKKKISNRINSNSTKKDYSHNLCTNHIFTKNTKSLNNFEINTFDLESISGHVQIYRPKDSSKPKNNIIIANNKNSDNMSNNKNNSKKEFTKKNTIIRKHQKRTKKLNSKSPYPIRDLKNANLINSTKNNPFTNNKINIAEEENSSLNNINNNKKSQTICDDISNNIIKVPQTATIKNNVIDLNVNKSNLCFARNYILLSPIGKNNSNKKINNVNKKFVKGHVSATSGNLINNLNIINSSSNTDKKVENQNKNNEKKYFIDDLFISKNLFLYNNTELNENKNTSRMKNKKIKSNRNNLKPKTNEKDSYIRKYKTIRKKIPYLDKDGSLFKYRSKSNEKISYANCYGEKNIFEINKMMVDSKENLRHKKNCRRVISYEMTQSRKYVQME